MGIVPLRGGLRRVERLALRIGVAPATASGTPLRVLSRNDSAHDVAFCAGCAAPIDFGAVTRGSDSYCSVECLLGGNPA
jgi:hypothetical protein